MQKFLTIEELSHKLKVSFSVIEDWVERGIIPYYRLPDGHILFGRYEIEEWLDQFSIEKKQSDGKNIISLQERRRS